MGSLVLTGHNVFCVHRVLVFDETKATHQLDLGDLSRTVGVKVIFDILLGDWKTNPGKGALESALPNDPGQGNQRSP